MPTILLLSKVNHTVGKALSLEQFVNFPNVTVFPIIYNATNFVGSALFSNRLIHIYKPKNELIIKHSMNPRSV